MAAELTAAREAKHWRRLAQDATTQPVRARLLKRARECEASEAAREIAEFLRLHARQ
jgi:hypothetical protein